VIAAVVPRRTLFGAFYLRQNLRYWPLKTIVLLKQLPAAKYHRDIECKV